MDLLDAYGVSIAPTLLIDQLNVYRVRCRRFREGEEGRGAREAVECEMKAQRAWSNLNVKGFVLVVPVPCEFLPKVLMLTRFLILFSRTTALIRLSLATARRTSLYSAGYFSRIV